MSIGRDEVKRIAELARLELPESALERMASDLSAVLDFVTALRRLELEGVEPTVFAPAHAALREDRVDGRRLDTEDALAMAPESEDGFFIVPPIVEYLT